METSQRIKEYLDSEGIICRRFNEILDIARDAGGNRKKLNRVLGKGYNGCQSEKEFYDRMYEFAGNAPISDLLKGRSREFLEWMLGKIIDRGVHGKVLDIGCGTGLEMCLFKELGAREVVGIEVNERLLLEARKRIKRRGLKNIRAVIGDRDKLEFPADYFDFITSLNSIVTGGEFYGMDSEYGYNYAIRNRIKQMARVLKKRGIATISMPVSEGYGEIYQDKLAFYFDLAGFPKILEKTQYESLLEGRIFVDVFVAARK